MKIEPIIFEPLMHLTWHFNAYKRYLSEVRADYTKRVYSVIAAEHPEVEKELKPYLDILALFEWGAHVNFGGFTAAHFASYYFHRPNKYLECPFFSRVLAQRLDELSWSKAGWNTLHNALPIVGFYELFAYWPRLVFQAWDYEGHTRATGIVGGDMFRLGIIAMRAIRKLRHYATKFFLDQIDAIKDYIQYIWDNFKYELRHGTMMAFRHGALKRWKWQAYIILWYRWLRYYFIINGRNYKDIIGPHFATIDQQYKEGEHDNLYDYSIATNYRKRRAAELHRARVITKCRAEIRKHIW